MGEDIQVARLGFSRLKDGTIVLTMTQKDYKAVLAVLKYFAEKNSKPYRYDIEGVEQSDGTFSLQLSRDDYNFILYAMGYATGSMQKDKKDKAVDESIRLVNRINQGNQEFMPYKVKDEA